MLKSVINGDYRISDIKYVDVLIKPGSSSDLPILLFLLLIILVITIIIFIILTSYCYLIKKAGLCDKCE